MNCIVEIAKKHQRDYITPEDVSEALGSHEPNKMRLDTLEVLGRTAGAGAEDSSLCAFVAWKGQAGIE